MILVDTSIWGHHLAKHNGLLARLLLQDEIVTHPFVIGELSLAAHKMKSGLIEKLAALALLPVSTSSGVMDFIARRQLAGTGVGWVDAHLLHCASVQRIRLWTGDRPLNKQAERLRIAFKP